MTLVDATTGEVLASMTPAEARSLTETIKASVDTLWTLLRESYDREAWRALGYDSWRGYATAEFGMSKSHAYRLLDQARVITEIEQAAGSPIGEISEHAARQLKPVLDEAVAAVKQAVADAPTTEQKQQRVRQALDDLRDTLVEERKPKAPEPTAATAEIAEFIDGGNDVQVARLRKRFADNLVRSAAAFTFDPEVVAPHLDEQDWLIVANTADQARAWFDRLLGLKPKRLRAIRGGN